MLRKNFPGRVNLRRKVALENLKSSTIPSVRIEREIEILEAKLKGM